MTSAATSSLPELSPLPPLSRILVIENDRVMGANLQQLFECEGYGVETADSTAAGHERLRNRPPSVVVLDLEVEDLYPRRFFKDIRSDYPSIPIIVLGVSSSVKERVFFLELGADDYVVKPFNGRELLARVRAAMRRFKRPRPDVFTFGDVQVDFGKMEVRRRGVLVTLRAQEFKVLKFLTRNAERPISRGELLNEAWGYQNYPTTRTVDNHILKLRQRLERQPSDPVHFVTVHRVGYKFVPDPGERCSGRHDSKHKPGPEVCSQTLDPAQARTPEVAATQTARV